MNENWRWYNFDNSEANRIGSCCDFTISIVYCFVIPKQSCQTISFFCPIRARMLVSMQSQKYKIL